MLFSDASGIPRLLSIPLSAWYVQISSARATRALTLEVEDLIPEI
jgi:hypothetical protein